MFEVSGAVLESLRQVCRAMQGAGAALSAAQGRRRLLKERYVTEETDYGRVSYGMRVASVDRLALVRGLISPK